jgi:hypothetical protein
MESVMSAFEWPNFEVHPIEIRKTGDEVAIYATNKGIEKLINLLERLRHEKTQNGSAHIHLEDYDVLTSNSLPLALVLMEDERPPQSS